MCCALSPLFPVCEWPFDASISHESVEDDFLDFNPITLPPPTQLDRSDLSFTGGSTIVKKLNHNASERDRRRKMNSLYSSLRSLLPLSEQTKRLSIPATVSRVLKYIPELQAQVERSVGKKEELLSRITRQKDEFIHQQSKSKDRVTSTSSPFAISATRVTKREVVVQISTFQAFETYPLSHILFNLEEDGLSLTEASCFESFGGRVLYNLHFQVEETCKLEGVVLNERLSSLYGKKK